MDITTLAIADGDNELSHFARALALPVRISIIRILIVKSDWVGEEAFYELKMGKITLEKHLRAMLLLSIIKEKRFDRKTYYAINEDVFLKISEEFMGLFDFFKTSWKKAHNERS